MAQDQWTLQEKEAVKRSLPAHRPPLQARVVAANRTVRTTCGFTTIPAHMEMNRGRGQIETERGQTDDVGSGHESGHGKGGTAGKAGRTGLLQANTAGG